MENSTKHRWYDVILAWANGEKIQFNHCNTGWTDYKPFGDNAVPAFNSKDVSWRIKPKVITKKYRVALVDMYAGVVVKEPFVKVIEITNSSIDYNIPGFICWVGDAVEVEIETD